MQKSDTYLDRLAPAWATVHPAPPAPLVAPSACLWAAECRFRSICKEADHVALDAFTESHIESHLTRVSSS